jgi:hypothetical protein
VYVKLGIIPIGQIISKKIPKTKRDHLGKKRFPWNSKSKKDIRRTRARIQPKKTKRKIGGESVGILEKGSQKKNAM